MILLLINLLYNNIIIFKFNLNQTISLPPAVWPEAVVDLVPEGGPVPVHVPAHLGGEVDVEVPLQPDGVHPVLEQGLLEKREMLKPLFIIYNI